MSSHDQISSDAYPLTNVEATEIAVEAYVYASAIVQLEVHRRVLTNQDVSDGKQMRGPMNQFYHLRNFPDASVREVVGPNFDTLYSILWYDVSDAAGLMRTVRPADDVGWVNHPNRTDRDNVPVATPRSRQCR